MVRNVLKKILYPFFKIGFDTYYKEPRNYTYKNITVLVQPDVFPPHFTISTKLLLDFLEPLNLKNKSVLELGCGSGIISLYAASKGAKVMATDINLVATNALKIATKKNNLEITIIESDLFENIPNQHFDYILINPPYYPKKANNIKEKAWFCGENFEYFENLFFQLKEVNYKKTIIILSEDCHLKTIKEIALKNNLSFELFETHNVIREINYIFKIVKS